MKLTEIDARGRSCPEPVLMTKKGIEKNPDGVKVFVDNTTAVENITRFANNKGYKIKVEDGSQEYTITLSR